MVNMRHGDQSSIQRNRIALDLDSPREEDYPTHRDKTAMNEAPKIDVVFKRLS